MNYSKFVKEKAPEMIKLLGHLIAYKSVMDTPQIGMPFGKEAAAALDAVLSAAKKLGFDTRNIDGYCGVADYLPEGCSDIKLGILCHLDVVPAGEGWTLPPYFLTEKDNRLYGRGATDDKGPAVSALYALYAVRTLCPSLKHGVRLIFGTNEENGSADIAHYLTKEKMPPMVFTPDASYPVINCEKGMIRLSLAGKLSDKVKGISGGDVINAVPARAKAIVGAEYLDILTKAAADISEVSVSCEDGMTAVEFNGKAAHASIPDGGINAITGLLDFLARYIKDDTVCALSRLFKFGHNDGSGVGIKMCDDQSGALTAVLSLAHTEGEKLVCGVDIRFPLCGSLDMIHNKIEGALSGTGITLCEFNGTEPHYTDPSGELVSALLKAYKDVTGEVGECIAIGGGTYVHEIDGGVAFGVEHDGTDYHIHGADEFVPIDEFIQNTVIFAKAIEEICG